MANNGPNAFDGHREMVVKQLLARIVPYELIYTPINFGFLNIHSSAQIMYQFEPIIQI